MPLGAFTENKAEARQELAPCNIDTTHGFDRLLFTEHRIGACKYYDGVVGLGNSAEGMALGDTMTRSRLTRQCRIRLVRVKAMSNGMLPRLGLM